MQNIRMVRFSWFCTSNISASKEAFVIIHPTWEDLTLCSVLCLRMILSQLTLWAFVGFFIMATSLRVKGIPTLCCTSLICVDSWESTLTCWRCWHPSIRTCPIMDSGCVVITLAMLQLWKEVLSSRIKILAWEGSRGGTHKIGVNQRAIRGSLAIIIWLNRNRVVSLTICMSTCKASLSSINIVRLSWRVIWQILSLVLAAPDRFPDVDEPT